MTNRGLGNLQIRCWTTFNKGRSSTSSFHRPP